MDTRFLESFVEVVDKGSIAEAARRLNLTAAAVAQRLRALEAEIGTPLVLRAGRTVKPTQTGLAILDRARALLRDVRDLRAVSVGGTLSGELRLGATTTALTGLMPAALAALAQAHPQVEVYIVPGVSADLYHQVLRGELDAAVILEPQFALPKSCEFETLSIEPLVVLSPAAVADWPAAARAPHALLRTQPFVRYDRNHWGGQIVDRYLRHTGIKPRERFELDSLEAIAAMVDRGLGVALVPDWAPPWPEGLALHKQPVPEPGWARHMGLFWARMSPRLPLVEALRAAASIRPGEGIDHPSHEVQPQ